MNFKSNLCLKLAVVFFGLTAPSTNAQDFELKENDQVVFLGSEFIEQQIKTNFLEAELANHWPDLAVSFRNLGWAGDSPDATARGYFGGQSEGEQRLRDELQRLKPSVIFLAYTVNTTAEEFFKQFEKLYSELKPTGAQIVIVSSPPAEQRDELQEQVAGLNQQRAKSTQQLKEFSQRESLVFIDLFNGLQNEFEAHPDIQYTSDSIRYLEAGYQAAAKIVLSGLGVPTAHRNTTEQENFDRLRNLIGEKNQLYFHRYRPQNETYLRGFRKHEQGQNAVEIASFDALIEQSEKRISAMVQGLPLPPKPDTPADIQLTFEALTPAAQKSEFQLAAGLEINLFAAEPMVANPIHMNFDHRGRLWVATSPIYPHIKPGAKPCDEIIILEDTDGDGTADKRTVFADDLLIPTAVLPDGVGGAYVANSTELLHLSDTDGDGRADSRRVVLAGFGTEDTHHILHTFGWGPDLSLHFNQSIYIHTHMETPFGVNHLMGSGLWRFQPQTGRAEIVMRGLVNPWGHAFDKYGQSFATDGAGGDGINYVFPGAAYATANGYATTLSGMNPGQPKHCGLEIINSRHFPDDWQATLATNDFRGNRINRFQLTEQGSGYVSKQLPDLLTSTHVAFRPVDLKLGPDGSLFIADWYNPIINHGEVDFRDSRRDYKHGRIWRVTAKNRPLNSKPDFKSLNINELVALLKTPEAWIREQARLQLRQRDPNAVISGLDRWIKTLEPSVAGDWLRLQGLWTYALIGQSNDELLDQLLASTDHRIRAAAMRITAQQMDQEQSNSATQKRNEQRLTNGTVDPHAQVRLEAANGLRTCPTTSAAVAAMQVLDQPMDPYLNFGLKQTTEALRPVWFPKIAAGENVFIDVNHLVFALNLSGDNAAIEPLLELLTTGKLSATQRPDAIEQIAKFANADQIGTLFRLAMTNKTMRPLILESLLRSSQQPTDIDSAQVKKMFDDPGAIELAGRWNIASLESELIKILSADSTASVERQLAAVRGLSAFNNRNVIHDAGSNAKSDHVRAAAIVELTGHEIDSAAILAAKFLSSQPAGSSSEPLINQVVDAFLQRKNGSEKLASVLPPKSLTANVMELILRRASSAGEAGKPLESALKLSFSTSVATSVDLKLTPEDVAAMMADISHGDPTRGEQIYRRAELGCLKCHAIGGAGGVVGPDIVSLGASSPVDYIIESLLEPNAKIKEGYHTTTIVTVDGRQISGKLMAETDQQVVLRDVDNRETIIPIEDIDDSKINNTSLMPTDLLKKLKRDELVDLVAFLSVLGKEGSFKVSNRQWVRTWIRTDDSPVFSRVDGSLPIADIGDDRVSFEIAITRPGPIGLAIEDPAGLQISVNDSGSKLTSDTTSETIVMDLPMGRHQIWVNFTGDEPRESLRIERVDASADSTPLDSNPLPELHFRAKLLTVDANEGIDVADFNNDGKTDVVAGRNWYPAPNFEPRPIRSIADVNGYVQSNCDFAMDVDADGWNDVVTGSFFTTEVHWFKNPGDEGLKLGQLWEDKLLVDTQLSENEASFLIDLDNDDQPEWISNSWNPNNPVVVWKFSTRDQRQQAPDAITLTKHQVGERSNSHGMGMGDINNDGREDILTSTGWFERPLENAWNSVWKFHPDWEIPGASVPMLVRDIDQDGKNDLIWGKGHDYGLYWWRGTGADEQGKQQFEPHTIDEQYSQVHVIHFADLDQDGRDELVAGKRVRAHNGGDPGASEMPCLYYYRWNATEKTFSRHVIDEGHVGTGLQIRTADLNGDGTTDIAVAGKDGTWILFNEPRKSGN